MAPGTHRNSSKNSPQGGLSHVRQDFEGLSLGTEPPLHNQYDNIRAVWVSGREIKALCNNGQGLNTLSKKMLRKTRERFPGSLVWENREDTTVALRWALSPDGMPFVNVFFVVDGSDDLSFCGDLESEMNMSRYLAHFTSYSMAGAPSTQELPWARPEGITAPTSQGDSTQEVDLYRSGRNTSGLLACQERRRRSISRSSAYGGVSKAASRRVIITAYKGVS